MIHISAVNRLSELKVNNKPVEFSIKYITRSTGAVIYGKRCVCTSSNFQRRTRNIMFVDSGEVRTVRNALIIEYNSQSVFL